VRFIVSAAMESGASRHHGESGPICFTALSRISIHLPALRDRMADLPLIVNASLDRLRVNRDGAWRFRPQALQLLAALSLAGQRARTGERLERAAVLADSGTMKCSICRIQSGAADWPGEPIEHLPAMHEAEYEAIVRAASACQGTSPKWRKCWAFGRTTLWRKIKASNIRVEISGGQWVAAGDLHNQTTCVTAQPALRGHGSTAPHVFPQL